MKANTRFTKERATLSRHRVLIFRPEAKVVPAPRRSINPLFPKAHHYESAPITGLQSN